MLEMVEAPGQAVHTNRCRVLQELRKQLSDARARGEALKGELDAAAEQRDQALNAVNDLEEQVHRSGHCGRSAAIEFLVLVPVSLGRLVYAKACVSVLPQPAVVMLT